MASNEGGQGETADIGDGIIGEEQYNHHFLACIWPLSFFCSRNSLNSLFDMLPMLYLT